MEVYFVLHLKNNILNYFFKVKKNTSYLFCKVFLNHGLKIFVEIELPFVLNKLFQKKSEYLEKNILTKKKFENMYVFLIIFILKYNENKTTCICSDM